MGDQFKYKFVSGKLIKTDLEGNELLTTSLNRKTRLEQSSSAVIGRSDTAATSEQAASFQQKFAALLPTTMAPREEIQPAILPVVYHEESPSSMESGAAMNGSDSGHVSPTVPLATPATNERDSELSLIRLEALVKRDQQAIKYSQNLLTEGDTLVFIQYPGKAYDSTGFCVSDIINRVHSEKILATGSERFREMLSPTKQFRLLRRKHINLANRLPEGIKYVLDLTPPDEGDEAVDLTANLSCSYGVRQWYSSEKRLSVPARLVAGKDAVMELLPPTIYSNSQPIPHSSSPLESIKAGDQIPRSAAGAEAIPAAPEFDASKMSLEDQDLATAIRRSVVSMPPRPVKSSGWNYHDPPEYDPIRHRSGILQLLRVIEGGDPGLDSALKVWTLFAIAQFFECTNIVMDLIVMWVIEDQRNTKFIEVLPEASWKLGFGLKSSLLARSSFAILVGEEALAIVSRSQGNNIYKKGRTQLGRRSESVDEDLKTRLEYASRSLVDRVNHIFEDLTAQDCIWFQKSLQIQKLDRFLLEIPQDLRKLWSSAVDLLKHTLRHWVRGKIFSTLTRDLSPDVARQAAQARVAGDYGAHTEQSYPKAIYKQLSSAERLMTVSFWRMLEEMHCGIDGNGEESQFNIHFENPDSDILAAAYQIERYRLSDLQNIRDTINTAILGAIQSGVYWQGLIPTACIFLEPEPPEHSVADFDSSWSDQNRQHHISNNFDDEFWNTTVPANHVLNDTKYVEAIDDGYGNPLRTLPHHDLDGSNPWHWGPGTRQTPEKILEETKDWRLRFTAGTTDFQPRIQEAIPFRQREIPSIKRQRRAIGPDKFPSLHHVSEDVGSFSSPYSASLQSPQDKTISNIPHHCIDSSIPAVPSFVDAPEAADNMSTFGAECKPRAVDKSRPVIEVPLEQYITTTSPFFNLTDFLRDATRHIDIVASNVLSRSDLGIDIELTDTLLCLNQEEWKYLPLWAGGDDDGSGGVFSQDLPTAVAGPSGPGPSFHTGMSLGSEGSYDGMSDTGTSFVNTSIAVEDGLSDTLARGKVVSDDGWRSEIFSDGEDGLWEGVGKGKMPVYCSQKTSEIDSESVASTVAATEDGMMSFNGGSEAGTETGYDFVEVGDGHKRKSYEISDDVAPAAAGEEHDDMNDDDDDDDAEFVVSWEAVSDDEDEYFDFGEDTPELKGMAYA